MPEVRKGEIMNACKKMPDKIYACGHKNKPTVITHKLFTMYLNWLNENGGEIKTACFACYKKSFDTELKSILLFRGKTKPSFDFVGTNFKQNETHDKFGKLNKGAIRACHIQTRWGHISIPFKYIGKKIEIIVKVKA